MASSNGYSVKIPSNLQYVAPLTGPNYRSWSKRMQVILRQFGYWSVMFKEVDVTELEEHKKAYVKISEKAVGLIGSAVDQDVIEIPITVIDDPVDLWNHLKELFEPSDVIRYLSLRKKLQTIKKTDSVSMVRFISDIEACCADITNCGYKIEDEEIACTILLALPESYDTLVTSYLAPLKKGDKLKLNAVKYMLTLNDSKDQVLKSGNILVDPSTALASTSRPFTPQITNGMLCYRCGGRGHGSRSCASQPPSTEFSQGSSSSYKGRGDARRTRRGGNGWRGRGRGRQPSQVEKPLSNSANFALFTQERYVLLCRKATREKWNISDVIIFDSGCSRHFICRKDWLWNIRQVSPEAVKCAMKSKPLMSYCSGDVLYQTSDNRLLVKDALYMPQFEVNLLSVGVLSHNGYVTTFDGDFCYLKTKQDKQLVATGVFMCGLYRVTQKSLVGSTIFM